MSFVPAPRKIIQIAVAGCDNNSTTQCNYVVVALCDDGTVWECPNNKCSWFKLKPIPQDVVE